MIGTSFFALAVVFKIGRTTKSPLDPINLNSSWNDLLSFFSAGDNIGADEDEDVFACNWAHSNIASII